MYTCKRYYDNITEDFAKEHARKFPVVDYEVRDAILNYMKTHNEFKHYNLDAVWDARWNRVDKDDRFNPRPYTDEYRTWWVSFLVGDYLYHAQITKNYI